MKLLQRLRELRNGPDALIDNIPYARYEFLIDADTEAVRLGASLEQDHTQKEIVDVNEPKTID